MSKRSSKIILTNEARVLKELRIEAGLSMRAAGKMIGLSDSTIAHIETGRMAIPSGGRLEELLRIYGGMKVKSFHVRVRKWSAKKTVRDELNDLIQRATLEQIKMIAVFVRSVLRKD